MWSGDDAHSGIAYYELYISRDGGELELVQGDLTGTSFEYTDSKGGSKCLFKIVAVDNVGLRAESTAEVTLRREKETQSRVVNTVRDVIDAYDGVTSIREAISLNRDTLKNTQTSSDLAGNARISGSKVDIGAYEYQTAFIETPDVEVVKSGKTLTVTWDAVYGASSYLVEYRDVKTAKWTAKTVKKGTSLAINGKVGTTYEIRVTAVTANGNSKAAVETVTVYAPLTTPKLKALKDFCKDDTFAVEVTNYAANLASAAESVTFGMNGIYETFTIENGSGNVRFASGEVVTFQNGTFTVTNAKSNTQYKLEVMFSNDQTGSAFAKANVKTTKTTYLAPTNFRVTASTSNSITLD